MSHSSRALAPGSVTKRFKVYAFYEITDDVSKWPQFSLALTKKECIRDAWSHHGHPCDDPRKRGGVVAEGELVLTIPPMGKATSELREYITRFEGSPAVLAIGNAVMNKRAWSKALSEQKRMLRRLRIR